MATEITNLLTRRRPSFGRFKNRVLSVWDIYEHLFFSEKYLLIEENEETHVYKRRWIVLLMFIILSLSNNLTQYSFAPVEKIVADYFKVGANLVNLLSIVFMISGFTVRFIGMWVIDNHGLGLCVFLASVFNTLGLWLRYYGSTYRDGYIWLLSGQIACAFGIAFLDIAGPKVSANWFPASQRTMATALASAPVFVGLLLGFVTAPLAIKSGQSIQFYMLYQALGGTGSMFLIWGFFRGTPPLPPTTSAGSQKLSFKNAVVSVFKLKNFMIIFAIFSIAGGGTVAFATLLAEIMAGFGWKDTKSSILGICWISTAIFGAGVASPLVDKTHAYKAFMVGTMFAVTISMVGFILLLDFDPDFYIAVYVAGGIMGIGASGIPAIIEAAIECTFPIPEGTVMGLLFLGFNVASILYTYGISHIRTEGSNSSDEISKDAIWLVCASYGIASILVVLFKPDYRRLAYEHKENKEHKEEYKEEVNS